MKIELIIWLSPKK